MLVVVKGQLEIVKTAVVGDVVQELLDVLAGDSELGGSVIANVDAACVPALGADAALGWGSVGLGAEVVVEISQVRTAAVCKEKWLVGVTKRESAWERYQRDGGQG